MSAYSYRYPRPSVTVDGLVFGFDPEKVTLEVLLIKRAELQEGQNPKDMAFPGFWALPGGFVEVSDGTDQGESLEAAASREIREETGANIGYLEQLGTFGNPGRDPRGRVISIAYFALVKSKDLAVRGDSDASEAAWFPIEEALRTNLAFDHNKILDVGVKRLQAKIRYAPVGFELLPSRFSLWDLQKLYEAILLRPLNKKAFRKRVLSLDILAKVGIENTVSHRPATLYRFDNAAYLRAVQHGFNFEI